MSLSRSKNLENRKKKVLEFKLLKPIPKSMTLNLMPRFFIMALILPGPGNIRSANSQI